MNNAITAAIAAALNKLYGIEVDQQSISLAKTKKEFEGNLTLVVFPWVKIARQRPDAVATAIGEELVASAPNIVSRYNAVGGFLNMVINPQAWAEKLYSIYNNKEWGIEPVTEQSPLVMIEYSSPNTNKPLHLGHVRNNLLGGALSRIQAAAGNRVVKTNIVNDRGIHICKSMLAWQKWGNGATPESTGKKGDHLIGDYYVAFDKHFRAELDEIVKASPEIQALGEEAYNAVIAAGKEEKEAISARKDALKAAAEPHSKLMQEAREMLVKWEQGDPEVRGLWARMNEWVYAGFDETYKMLGVSFDKIYYESQTYLVGKQTVLDGLERGLFEKHDDGSVWADLTNEGLDQKLLLRKDGTSVYMTQDIGTAQLRYKDFPIDKMIYVVGNEQEYHFQVLSILLDRLGFKWGKDLVHFSYGMVELPNGKMKSREGTVVDADDLVAKMIDDARTMSEDKMQKLTDLTPEEADEIARIVGLGALKFFILKVDARKNMLFNPEESIDFNGFTGPFVQYTCTRINSILRKAPLPAPPSGGADGSKADDVVTSLIGGGATPNDKEIELIQKIADLPAEVKVAAGNYNPSSLAQYSYDLAKLFNSFYHDYSILNAETEELKSFRLVLAATVARTLKTALGLLGIEVPERM